MLFSRYRTQVQSRERFGPKKVAVEGLMPADGILAATKKQDLGTSRRQL
jgi:hypothetical protein